VEGLIPPIAPAVVLSALVGAFYSCMYVVIRGTIGRHLPLTLVAAIAGAFGGHLVGRLAGDPVQLGDFNVLWASMGAWVGIIAVAGIAAIRPADRAGTTRGPARLRRAVPRTATEPGPETGAPPGTGIATGSGAPSGSSTATGTDRSQGGRH
jgi:hypothetical protein